MVQQVDTPIEEQATPEADPNELLIAPTPTATEETSETEATEESKPTEATETPVEAEEKPGYEALSLQVSEQSRTIEKLTARLNTQEGMVRRSRERDISEGRRDQILEAVLGHLEEANPDLGLKNQVDEIRNRSDNEVRQDQQDGIVAQMATQMNAQLAAVGVQANDPRIAPMIKIWNDAQVDGKVDFPLLHEAYGDLVGFALNIAQRETKLAKEDATQSKSEAAAEQTEAENVQALNLESGPSAGGGGAMSNQEWMNRWGDPSGGIPATVANSRKAEKLMDEGIYAQVR